MRYPPSYAPRDSLAVTDEMLDWTGDHLRTNFRDLFIWMREQGYYLETLGCAFTCFNASEYAALLLVDARRRSTAPSRSREAAISIMHRGLSLLVLADWYSPAVMKSLRFFDENRSRGMQ